MKKRISLIAIVIIAVAAYLIFPLDTPDYGRKILVFTKTQSERHDSTAKAVEVLSELGNKGKFNVVASEDAGLFTEKNLKTFQAVVFLNTSGNVLDAEQQDVFERYIQAGGGFVGIHGAADTEWREDPWYWYQRLVGAVFDGKSDTSDVTSKILVVDRNQSLTASLTAEWIATDQWLRFKRVSEGVQLLLTAHSIQNADGEAVDKPLAWYREFDGGRSVYSALGHTEAVFDDKNYRSFLLSSIQYAMGNGQLDYSESKPEKWRYSRVQLDAGLDEPIKIAFTPTGELYYLLRKGELVRYDFDQKKSVRAGMLPVYTVAEYGLLGLAFGPDFKTSQWVYLLRIVADGDTGKGILSRFKLKDGVLDLGTEQELLSYKVSGNEQKVTAHTGGDMQFDAKGNLWVATGDDTAAGEHGHIDDRAGHETYDVARTAANTQDLRGKILRIRPRDSKNENGFFYDIPDGNLFNSESEGRPEIYVMGVRNPYTIAYDDRNETLYWGEVGPDAREDSARGPMGYDEINRTKVPGNFGWPYVIANNLPYSYYDYENEEVLDQVNPAAPENRSKNNTGRKVLPLAQDAWIYYPYTDSEEFFDLGSGGRNALVTTPYYAEDYADSAVKFPAALNGKLIVGDFVRRWIKVVNLDSKGAIESITPLIDHQFSAPLDMAFGPDGALYVIEYGTNWYQKNPDAYLSRIEFYAGENPPPVAVAQITKAVGAAPLKTVLDASQSYDRGVSEGKLKYRWELLSENGSVTELGNQKIQPVTISSLGEHRVRLTVTDEAGLSDSKRIALMVGNETPEVSIKVNGNSSFYRKDQKINYAVSVVDLEDGSTADGSISADQVSVHFTYIDKASDIDEVLNQYQTDPIIAGREFVKGGSDCHACHQIDTSSLGPSFTAIAQRYYLQIDGLEYLQKVIANGGAGKWAGTHAMPAHPGLNEAQLLAASSYILSLAGEKDGASGLELNGSLGFEKHDSESIKAVFKAMGEMDLGVFYPGKYLLHASYSDKGGNVSPLQGSHHRTFYSPRQMASFFDPGRGTAVVKIPDNVEAMLFTGADNGEFTYATKKQIDLTGVTSIEIQTLAVSAAFKGGLVELRLDDPSAEASASANLETYLIPGVGKGLVRLDVSAIDGTHDLYLGTIPNPKDLPNQMLYLLLGVEFNLDPDFGK